MTVLIVKYFLNSDLGKLSAFVTGAQARGLNLGSHLTGFSFLSASGMRAKQYKREK